MPGRLLDDEFVARLERLEVVARKLAAGRLAGERRSRKRGYSTEFSEHRPYVPGDDIRFLDWNIYGRLERLFLKVFLDEEELRMRLLVDSSRSMRFGSPDKLEYAKRLLAALGYIGLVHQDRVEVWTCAGGVRRVFGPLRGRAYAQRLFTALEELEPDEDGTTDLEAAARSAGRAAGGLTVLVSDFFDRRGPDAALRRLGARSATTEIFAFHVLAPEEIDPDLRGDLRLIDCEDGTPEDVTAGRALLDRYRRTLEAFRDEVRDACVRRGIHYVFTSTSVPFDRLVFDYLRRRGLLR